MCCVLANATDFGLKIAGRDITSDGYIDAGQSTGKIYWNGTSLTFTDVEVNHTSTSTAFVSYTGEKDLIINFVGTTVISSSSHIFRSYSSGT